MGTLINNEEDFYAFCDKHEIKFVDLRFTDIKGVWHHITYNYGAVKKDILADGFPFDGSSIDAWQPINKSDMILKADIKTTFIDPFSTEPTVIVICDVYDIYKSQLYEKCPRSIAKKSIEYLHKTSIGDTVYFGPENEFYIFDNILIRDDINNSFFKIDSTEGEWSRYKKYEDDYNTGHRPGTKGGYFPVPPTDSMMDLRAEICEVLKEVGIETFVNHHEVAQAQGEIGVKFSTLVEAADNIQKYKYVVKMVAHLNGKTATFMPKPLYGDNGNGMHVHQSIWKNGKNLFYEKGKYGNLSKTAINYIGGILKHARSLASFTNPTTNSYKRLVPGFEAPCILTYSSQNRSASCRIPYGGGKNSTRIEVRFPDSSSNPYLAFSSLLLAGLDGIKNNTTPDGPMDENLFKLTLDEIRKKGIKQLPHTLRGSLESLIRDNEYLSPILSRDFIETYQNYKFQTQVWPYEARPTSFEFKTTYSC